MDIHFAINPRSKNYFQFAPVIPCMSVQCIDIIYRDQRDRHAGYHELSNGKIVALITHEDALRRYKTLDQIKELAINDGFDSVEQFFAWFNKDFKGQIIHWTDLRY